MWPLVLALALICAQGCGGTSFRDCAVSCTAQTGCPDGFSCGSEGLCRPQGGTISCADMPDAVSGDGTSGPGAVVPSNGLDVGQFAMVDVDISIGGGTATFDTDTGEISGALTRAPGQGVSAGIGFAVASTATPTAVFTVHRFAVAFDAKVHFTGHRAFALLVETTATFDGLVDATGGCYGADTGCAGPGGGPGADESHPATGCGPGGNGDNGQYAEGGGGGGGRLPGARGGLGYRGGVNGGAAGNGCLTATAEPLVGGSGGGLGGMPPSDEPVPPGGGGGGAIQITAMERILVGGTINVGGAGGAGKANRGGTGGGSGGSLLLEARSLELTGLLSANGGGGGGGCDVYSDDSVFKVGGDGQPGQVGATQALGGASTSGPGGRGAAGTTSAEAGLGRTSFYGHGGGGGGGVGTIYLRASSTPLMSGAIISPPPGIGAVRTR